MTEAKAAKLQDTLNYPPRGMDADRAATYYGVSMALFLKGVENGEWPQPKDASGQPQWDRVELDAAWDWKVERLRSRSSSARRLVATGFCIALAGCSGAYDVPVEPTPAPSIPKAIPVVKFVAGQYHLTGQLEIAGPVEAPAASLTPWVICLKSGSEPRFTVALFYKADTLVSSRVATIGDGCDSQAYQPLPP